MNVAAKITAFTLLALCATSFAVPNTSQQSLVLSVRLQDLYNPDVTILVPLRANKPFRREQNNGAVRNSVFGVLRPSTAGKYRLTLTVSEWKSKVDHIQDTNKLDLELNKPQSYGPVLSLVYMRTVTLTKK